MIVSIFRSRLRIRKKSDALEFYDGVKSVILIPFDDNFVIRVEPNKLIGLVDKDDIARGMAWAVPNIRDDDGTEAYHLRKYINAYLAGD